MGKSDKTSFKHWNSEQAILTSCSRYISYSFPSQPVFKRWTQTTHSIIQFIFFFPDLRWPSNLSWTCFARTQAKMYLQLESHLAWNLDVMGECPDFLHLSLFLKGEKAEQSFISAHTASTAQSPRGPLTWLCQMGSLLTQQCATQLCVMHTPRAIRPRGGTP